MQFGLPHKTQVRRWFHWKRSGVVVPLFFFFGWAMVGVAASLSTTEPLLFLSALVLFCLTLVWTLGSWLTSDALGKRDPSAWNRNRRRASDLKLHNAIYLTWKYVGCAAWVAIFIFCVGVTWTIWNNKELSQLHGVLIPANEPMPHTPCGSSIGQKSVILMYGDNAAVVDQFPHTVLHSRSLGPMISLDRLDNGSIVVLMDIKDPEGRLVARLDRNGFTVNPNRILTMARADKSSLTITDEYGVTVLNIHFPHSQVIQIDGAFHYPGSKESTPLQFPRVHGVCTEAARQLDFDIA